jgi:hypothetical protein
MKPLYEINSDYYKWLEKVQEAEGELTEEMIIEFESISENADIKHEAYAVIIKQLEGENELVKAEKQRLAERQVQTESRIEWLKSRLANSLEFFGKDKFETPKCKISFRSSTAVEIVDEAKLPDEYFKIERKPMKSEIKEALKAGVAIDGAVLVERKNIQIK